MPVVIDKQHKQAAEIIGEDPEFIDRYSFSQTFSSTAGPNGGIGGQALTVMTVDAYTDGEKTVFYCDGKFVKCVLDWDPHTLHMP